MNRSISIEIDQLLSWAVKQIIWESKWAGRAMDFLISKTHSKIRQCCTIARKTANFSLKSALGF